MKKICITLILISIIILTAGIVFLNNKTDTEYLRIHIRADSNEVNDQAVKYKVKDAVVLYLTPYIAECKTKQDAENMLKENLSKIEQVANETLERNGFQYSSKASVRDEEFPTRKYGEYTLEAGFYEALIIELGSGQGNNWWCVVYPPLCFTGEGNTNYIYKSKILEIIDKFNKENHS